MTTGSVVASRAMKTLMRVSIGPLLIIALAAGCEVQADPFVGVCLGEPYASGRPFSSCGELFNDDGRAFCEMHEGCSWDDCEGTCGFCEGQYAGCLSREDEGGCADEPGCRWLAPPACGATWEECVISWLRSGGCEEVERTATTAYGSVVDGESVTVRFADHCD